MKNWKTTLAGLLAGLPFAIDAIMQAYTAGYFTGKTGWQLFGAIAVIFITTLAKDHNVTGGSVQNLGGSNPPPKKDEK